MNESATMPGPAALSDRKCRIEDVFDLRFIELLQLVPRNPHVRALILKMTGIMPGPELETFEQIQNWVETTCDQKLRPTKSRHAMGSGGISIAVDFNDTENGRADYSTRRSGSSSFHLNAEELIEIVQTAIADGDGVDEVVELIAASIEENAWSQCEPELDCEGDYDYTDHEFSSSGNGDMSFSRDEIRDCLITYLRTCRPELTAELQTTL